MITIQYTLDDADIEAGLTLSANGVALKEFLPALVKRMLEEYRGATKRALLEKAQMLTFADLPELEAILNAKVSK